MPGDSDACLSAFDDDGDSSRKSREDDDDMLLATPDDVPASTVPAAPRRRRAAAPTTGAVGVWLAHEDPYKPVPSSSAAEACSAEAAEQKRVVGFERLVWEHHLRLDCDVDEDSPAYMRSTWWGTVNCKVTETRIFEEAVVVNPEERLGDAGVCFFYAEVCAERRLVGGGIFESHVN